MSFFFSSFSISSHWELHWPVKFERYLVFVHCIKIDPYSFDYSLFCFESFFIDFFLILSLHIWFHLIFTSNLVLILFTSICLFIYFLIDFYFQFNLSIFCFILFLYQA